MDAKDRVWEEGKDPDTLPGGVEERGIRKNGA